MESGEESFIHCWDTASSAPAEEERALLSVSQLPSTLFSAAGPGAQDEEGRLGHLTFNEAAEVPVKN